MTMHIPPASIYARIHELSQCEIGTVWPILQRRISNLPCDLGNSKWQHSDSNSSLSDSKDQVFTTPSADTGKSPKVISLHSQPSMDPK